jgi:putative metallohydrolase (TIGR04338 family)
VPPYAAGGGWALSETTVLHELAHHLGPDRPAHGPVFLAHLLHLYEHVIGPEAAHLLRVALAERGVTTGAPL